MNLFGIILTCEYIPLANRIQLHNQEKKSFDYLNGNELDYLHGQKVIWRPFKPAGLPSMQLFRERVPYYYPRVVADRDFPRGNYISLSMQSAHYNIFYCLNNILYRLRQLLHLCEHCRWLFRPFCSPTSRWHGVVSLKLIKYLGMISCVPTNAAIPFTWYLPNMHLQLKFCNRLRVYQWDINMRIQ